MRRQVESGHPDARVKPPPVETERGVVEVLLRGGLGNQLFGFATGLEIARQRGIRLRLITSLLGNEDQVRRQFELSEVARAVCVWSPNRITTETYREKSFAYDPAISDLKGGILIDGYFQSEKYFSNSASEIRDLITGAESFSSGFNEAKGRRFIGLQVRRGDYLQPEQLRFHGLATTRYFVRAAKVLRKLNGELPITIFSDDAASAEELVDKIPNASLYETESGSSSLKNLGVIASATSLCISNSSFGWWAAHLMQQGYVVTPRPWFKDRRVDTNDLLPDSWLSIGSSA
jgi:hypothetical protein